jgi:hypothetical protein
MLLPLQRQAQDALSLLVLIVVNLIDTLANKIQAETALPAAVKDRCRRRLGIERLTRMQECQVCLLVIYFNG